MESQPQNPEFRNNPENFHPCSQYITRGASNVCLNLCLLGSFCMFFCHLLVIFKINCFEKSFQDNHQCLTV